jgi:TDG/mug DNA glycosylase family protein
MASARISSFAPLAAPGARILILGSMPGAASLAAGQYYAHPRNAFWPVMGVLFGAGLDKPYDERAAILKARGVAVWDVLQYCVRPGSLDSDISDEVPNDFASFFRDHPGIGHVYLNGGKAASAFRKFVGTDCPVVTTQLPSTSPAHAGMSFEKKLAAWRVIVGRG